MKTLKRFKYEIGAAGIILLAFSPIIILCVTGDGKAFIYGP